MKVIKVIILLVLIVWLSEQKLVRKYFKKDDLRTSSQSLFLTKFDIGKGGGNIKIIVMHRPSEPVQRLMNFNIIKDTSLTNYTHDPCHQSQQQKSQIMIYIRPEQTARQLPFTIQPQDREHIFYLYLENCNKSLERVIQGDEQLTLEITLLNGDSHFGEDENMLMGYVLLVVVWAAMIVYFFKAIGEVLIRSFDEAKFAAFIGLIVVGIAYFYRLLHLLIYNVNGQGIFFFQYLYYILKSLCEFVIVTYLCAIAWGWSITHLKHDQTYLLAGVSVGIINVIGICVSVSADQMAQIHHKYDSTAGYILQILRAIIVLIFFIGILRTLSLSVGNIRKFIKKFSFIGGFYLSSWPLIVLFSQMFLPNYMHNQVITLTQEITHMIASGLLCQILSNPESTYRKVSMKADDNPFKMNNYKHK